MTPADRRITRRRWTRLAKLAVEIKQLQAQLRAERKRAQR